MSGISVTTLRFYDKENIFKPAFRDSENGYRFYTLDQIVTVNFVKTLLFAKVPLKRIAHEREIRTPDSIGKLIDEQYDVLEKQKQLIINAQDILAKRKTLIERGKKAQVGTVQVENWREKSYTIGSPTNWEKGKAFYNPFVTFCKEAKNKGIILSFPIGGIHKSWSNFLEATGEPEYFFSSDVKGQSRVPAGEYLVGYAQGFYGNFGDIPKKMDEFSKKNKLKTIGNVYSLYILDELCISDIDKYVSQIAVMIQREK